MMAVCRVDILHLESVELACTVERSVPSTNRSRSWHDGQPTGIVLVCILDFMCKE